MLKQALSGILFILLAVAGFSQSIKQCGERKKEVMQQIVQQGRNRDTAALRQLGNLNSEWQECVVGKEIPDFKARTLSGEKLDTKKLRGKIVVLNFWFINCAPCVAEMPALNKLVSDYKDKDVVFISITHDDKASVKQDFLPKHPFDFTIVTDARSIEEDFSIGSFPSTFIVDADGKVQKAWTGGATNERAKTEAYNKAKPVIDELLQKKAGVAKQ
ncbi:MAG: TlpA disulfide reductase family protein [Chitinophagaceae bacterium]